MVQELTTPVSLTKDDPSLVQATSLLSADPSRHKKEGNVQSDIEALMRTLDVGTLESQYQTGDGPVDLYLPNRRTLIELKAYPLAADPTQTQPGRDESALEQLTRYVRAEIDQELILSPSSLHSSWTGIVSDSKNWHIYEYKADSQSEVTLKKSINFIDEAEALVLTLKGVLGDEMIGKEWVPTDTSTLFTELRSELDQIYKQIPTHAKATTQTKFQLWLDMMRASGMVPADDEGQRRLFLTHTFLIAAVRFVSFSLTLKDTGDDWIDVLKDGFTSWLLDFQLAKEWAGRLYARVSLYDWRKRRGDVLRDLYNDFVSAQDRKLFGEFYTPDWLAEFMVEQVLDDKWITDSVNSTLTERVDGIGVLDPTCGSGTFLYHAAMKLASSDQLRIYQPTKRADVICRLLNGIDIHPVAVEIAKVNIQRALPAIPSEGSTALQVYLGDSLQISLRDDIWDSSGNLVLETPKGLFAHIPMKLLRSHEFHEYLRRLINAAVAEKELPRGLPEGIDKGELKKCFEQFKDIVKSEGNSVWTWYCANLVGPRLLAERKINRILANPPWVKLSDIQVVDRKRSMEELGRELSLQAGGNLAPHLDIASYFVIRTRSLYLTNRKTDVGAWIVKASALRAGQWGPFRLIHKNHLAQSIDLTPIQPFGGGDATRCCILFEHRKIHGNSDRRLIGRVRGKKRPRRSESLKSALSKFEIESAPIPIPQERSEYASADILEGATIVPHVLGWVGAKGKADLQGVIQVRTKASMHRPWKNVAPQFGEVPIEWIRIVLTSREMLAYVTVPNPSEVIIPTSNLNELLQDPGSHSDFWLKLEEIYDVNRGQGRSTPRTLLGNFDYRKKLSVQLNVSSDDRRLLLYPSSGDHMRAVRVQAGGSVADSTLFWFLCQSEDEAGYLVSLLNASCLNRAFSESKESGRDFQLHPWKKVPIPMFDESNSEHIRLADLCRDAEILSENLLEETLKVKPELGQPGLTKRIRSMLSSSLVGQEINELAASVLPDQAV